MTTTTQAKHTPEPSEVWVPRELYQDVCEQRDALAAALRQIIQWSDPGPQPTYSDNMRDIEAAWAALAKVTS